MNTSAGCSGSSFIELLGDTPAPAHVWMLLLSSAPPPPPPPSLQVWFRKVLRLRPDLTEDVNCAAGCSEDGAGARQSVPIKCELSVLTVPQRSVSDTKLRRSPLTRPSDWAWRCVHAPPGTRTCGTKAAGMARLHYF